MEPWAMVKGTPMARSTWEGCSDPEVQAEPEEAQMPNSLSIRRMASPSMNSKLMLLVLGRRSSRSPFTRLLGMRGQEGVFQLIPQGLHPGVFLLQALGRQFAGLAQADDAGDVFGAAPAALFLVAADQEGGELGALAHVEGPHALGGVQFVAGERQHVDGVLPQVDGDLAHGLHRVGVEQDALVAGHGRQPPPPGR